MAGHSKLQSGKAGHRYVSDGPFLPCTGPGLPDWPFGPGKRFYMILNIAVTSIPAVGSPAGSQFPVEMVVNYVHVWQ
jgi:hypothetical protein